ncbi:MAG: type VI secretion protein, partial [Pseudomonadota bacterium]|nr:type VI secretion protein [Pseudomonadota bacterium]
SGYATPFAPTVAPTTVVDRQRERLNAPTLVVDFALADTQRLLASSQAAASQETQSDSGAPARTPGPGAVIPVPGAGGGAAPADRNLSDTERFSARVGTEEVEVAKARRMAGLDRLIPQGAVIGAVMETALNSDLPGFARATVLRDVRSFDGSAILIPAGSRVIGQYKSGVAQGASRVFVLWTRLIRPDGVSIELASPATDDLGRAGISGKVNRHFLQRYGGGILTSVISGAISAAAASLSGGSTIIVGSAGEAASLARQAGQTDDIPPTITTRQGANVRIFVARDLDFSLVGPAR